MGPQPRSAEYTRFARQMANSHAQAALAQMGLLAGTQRAVPKGTKDVVMERLFPKKRSTVPIDDERRQEVFVILVACGALTDEGAIAA